MEKTNQDQQRREENPFEKLVMEDILKSKQRGHEEPRTYSVRDLMRTYKDLSEQMGQGFLELGVGWEFRKISSKLVCVGYLIFTDPNISEEELRQFHLVQQVHRNLFDDMLYVDRLEDVYGDKLEDKVGE